MKISEEEIDENRGDGMDGRICDTKRRKEIGGVEIDENGGR